MAKPDLLDDYIEVYMTGFKYVGDLVSAPMKQYKLSFEQFLIMRDLHRGSKLSISDVAKSRGVTRAAISRQIKTLLENDYIIQERDATDRRRLYLRLTERGEQVTTALNATIHQRFYGWVQQIGDEDAEDLLRIMRRVAAEIIH
ncbi:MarR family winged helix-turn-helix transcriptional regulator [Lacticaseibacillus parakribbianus]|uniref:MarR family winged helix-turn-helix transcriptional regulator n=1 Tax=Lacticaseibacillus parakribbianus TaxID=2970927 RepID=UPI0021CB9673|nr:MarR family transcriptional regulator [Lacticaseibacillus parakribbianus]